MNNFGRTSNRIIFTHNNTGTLSYTYRPGGQLSLAGWTNGQNAAMSNLNYEYDQYNRLTGIKLNNVNEVSYTLNAKDQRTAATYANAGLWNFTYDDKGQVTGIKSFACLMASSLFVVCRGISFRIPLS